MKSFAIDPHMMGVIEWTDQMAPELEPFGDIPILETEDKWKDWASSVINNPLIAQRQPPEPTYFQNWRDWAYRFIQTIHGLST